MTNRDVAGDQAGSRWRRRLYTRRDMLRFGAAGAGTLIGGQFLAACGSSSSSTTTTAASGGKPKTGGTLNFGRETGPTQLDPANSIVEGDVYTLDKIFEPLYITSPAGQLVPWLAQGHTVSTDGKTWTFALRPGVKFSDGKPVTAEDVVFSIKRAAGDANGPLSFLDFAIKSLKADGTSSVVATLSQPWAPFLSDISVFANAILPKDFGGQSESAFFASPVGTGPFTLKSFVKGGNVSLARNPHYWQAGKPYLNAVEFVYISDDNQRVLQLKSGQVQVISAVPPAQVSALKADSSVVLEAFPSWAVDLLFFNEKVPQFADRHVRRAINYALNVPAIAKATTYGTAKPGGSFFPPSLQYYTGRPHAELQPQRRQGRAGEVEIPARVLVLAAGVERQLAVRRRGDDHPAAAQAARHHGHAQPARQRRLPHGLRGLQLPGDDQRRDQRHQRPGRDGVVPGGRQERRLPFVLDLLRQPERDRPGRTRPRRSSTTPSARRCTGRSRRSSRRTHRTSRWTTRRTSTPGPRSCTASR